MSEYPEWSTIATSTRVRTKTFPRLLEDMPTFLGVPVALSAKDLEGADVVIIGAPFAAGWGNTYSGVDKSAVAGGTEARAPAVDSLHQLRAGLRSRYLRLSQGRRFRRRGHSAGSELRRDGREYPRAQAAVEVKVNMALDAGAIPIVIGQNSPCGSYAIAKPIAERTKGNVGMISLDTHWDSRPMDAATATRASRAPATGKRSCTSCTRTVTVPNLVEVRRARHARGQDLRAALHRAKARTSCRCGGSAPRFGHRRLDQAARARRTKAPATSTCISTWMCWAAPGPRGGDILGDLAEPIGMTRLRSDPDRARDRAARSHRNVVHLHSAGLGGHLPDDRLRDHVSDGRARDAEEENCVIVPAQQRAESEAAANDTAGGVDNHLAALNVQQRLAVLHGIGSKEDSEQGALLVIAGAGSGKTNTLAYRVAQLVYTGADPHRILLLTFSRRAAAEMERRAGQMLHRVLGMRAARADIAAVGRHVSRRRRALAARVRRAHRPARVVHHPRPRRLRRPDGHRPPRPRPLRHEEPLSRQGHVPRHLFARGQQRGAARRRAAERLLRGARSGRPSSKRCSRRTSRRSRRRTCSTTTTCCSTGRDDGASRRSRASVGARFDHVLVDEYQDTNRLQASILLALKPDGRGVTVVGDDAQSIYSFRAATVRNILDFPDAVRARRARRDARAQLPLDAADPRRVATR